VSELVRFSVSLEADLLDKFDEYCQKGQFATRGEAIRQLLRERLTQPRNRGNELLMNSYQFSHTSACN
jgi:CopG family nickel-responsive transcriptional regulator